VRWAGSRCSSVSIDGEYSSSSAAYGTGRGFALVKRDKERVSMQA
jgi:hypothetical protein